MRILNTYTFQTKFSSNNTKIYVFSILPKGDNLLTFYSGQRNIFTETFLRYNFLGSILVQGKNWSTIYIYINISSFHYSQGRNLLWYFQLSALIFIHIGIYIYIVPLFLFGSPSEVVWQNRMGETSLGKIWSVCLCCIQKVDTHQVIYVCIETDKIYELQDHIKREERKVQQNVRINYYIRSHP